MHLKYFDVIKMLEYLIDFSFGVRWTNILTNQRTNGPVNAHLISWPSKAKNIQNLEIYGKEMTLTFNTHIPS